MMPRSIRFDAVADIYDAYVKVDFDVAFFLEEARKAGGKVLELTSGTGRVSIPLLEAGIDLTCVDYSAAMLDVLRRKAGAKKLSCPIVVMDMADLTLRARYRLAFIPFNSFSETTDRPKQERILERVRAHIVPAGRFICTMQNPVVRTPVMDGRMMTLGQFPMETGGSLCVRSCLCYDERAQLASGQQFYELRRQNGEPAEERVLDICFYLFSKGEFERMACAAGFEVEALFGNYDRSPFVESSSPFMIWVLKRG